MDLAVSDHVVLSPEMGRQLLPTGINGPLPPGTWGLLLGRSSTTLKGLTVFPGVIDQDYTGEIKVMAATMERIIDLPRGTRVAQLILLPLIAEGRVKETKRGTGGFGSSDAYWVTAIKNNRPTMNIWIEEKLFSGILDTGADVSVISSRHWPRAWPSQEAYTALQGIGQSTAPRQSSALLRWRTDAGAEGTIQPYIVDNLPVNLWGRDLMQQMRLYLGGPDLDSPPRLSASAYFPPGH